MIKGIIETIKNETNKLKGGFLGILLGTLGASLLGNLLKEQVMEQLELVEAQLELDKASQDF